MDNENNNCVAVHAGAGGEDCLWAEGTAQCIDTVGRKAHLIIQFETFIVNITWQILNELCKFKLYTKVQRKRISLNTSCLHWHLASSWNNLEDCPVLHAVETIGWASTFRNRGGLGLVWGHQQVPYTGLIQ